MIPYRKDTCRMLCGPSNASVIPSIKLCLIKISLTAASLTSVFIFICWRMQEKLPCSTRKVGPAHRCELQLDNPKYSRSQRKTLTGAVCSQGRIVTSIGLATTGRYLYRQKSHQGLFLLQTKCLKQNHCPVLCCLFCPPAVPELRTPLWNLCVPTHLPGSPLEESLHSCH